jgi:hypothetical protein
MAPANDNPIIQRIRREDVTDAEVDQCLEPELRSLSERYWTPVEVARVAAKWLTEAGARRVLDIGSGVGKFCIVGAATTTATFVGIEHREPLVVAAREAAVKMGVGRQTMFIHAPITYELLIGYSAFYLFNPFAENLFAEPDRIDSTVELGSGKLIYDVNVVGSALRSSPAGTRVVTYHGFGGPIPDNLDVVEERPMGTDVLRLWVKSGRAQTGVLIETQEGLLRLPLRKPRD